MSAERNDKYKKSLKYSIIDGSAYSIMTGFGETNIQAFAINVLKASNLFIAFLASIPQLIGSLAQLFSAKLLDKTGNRKKIVVAASFFHMFTWVPIFLLPFSWFEYGALLLIIYVAVYFAYLHLTVPAWNSWMGDLVAPEKRGDYFGQRNRLASVFNFLSVLVAGVILELWKPVNEWIGFGFIFGIAFIARGVSVYYLTRIEEPVYKATHKDRFTLWDFVRRSPKSNFARFVFYITLINFSLMVSGPFFGVYMLRELNFSYVQFTIVNATNVITLFLVMRYWGRLGDRFGNKRILSMTGWLIAFPPLLWLFSSNFYWILFCQVMAGLIWSGFNLASANYLFDAVSPAKRARCVAYQSLFNNVGVFLGAITGGFISHYLSSELIVFGRHFYLISALMNLFVLSALMRLLISAIFLPLIKEVREKVELVSTWKLFFHVLHVRPIMGPRFQVFTGDEDENTSS
ncbi:MAG: MFS transporter [Planctomycetes bacterium]|nr:MFS transporter [Planctomycetota bacterium]